MNTFTLHLKVNEYLILIQLSQYYNIAVRKDMYLDNYIVSMQVTMTAERIWWSYDPLAGFTTL